MMGTEIGQFNEWHYEYSLDWHLLQYPQFQKHHAFFQALNNFYLSRSELWEQDDSWEGFQWVEANDANGNTLIYLRRDKKKRELLIAVNFSPIDRVGYQIGVPVAGTYEVLFNSDDEAFGGQGRGSKSPLKTKPVPAHDFKQSLVVDLPPLSGLILRCSRKNPVRAKKVEPTKTAVKRAGAKKKTAKSGKK